VISHKYRECNWCLVEIGLKFDDLRELLLTWNQVGQPWILSKVDVFPPYWWRRPHEDPHGLCSVNLVIYETCYNIGVPDFLTGCLYKENSFTIIFTPPWVKCIDLNAYPHWVHAEYFVFKFETSEFNVQEAYVVCPTGISEFQLTRIPITTSMKSLYSDTEEN